MGLAWRPSWQDAIEPAQVIAGIVQYPPGNPVYLYAIRTWTVLHEGLALLLAIGISERTLALALSGVMGMLSFQALGVIVLAVSGDVALGMLAPTFIAVTGASAGGVTYAAALLGWQYTYGVVGTSYLLLTIALAGAGWRRSAAAMLGFAPAIHPILGGFGILMGLTTAACMRDPSEGRRRELAPWLAAGIVAAAACALIHRVVTGPAPPGTLAAALTQHWDWHRQPFPLFSGRALATWLSAALPAFWLWRHGHDAAPPVRLLLRLLVAAAVLGGGLSIAYWVGPADAPNPVAALMPSRLLNLNVITCMALILGLSARFPRSAAIQGTMTVLVIGLLAGAGWAWIIGGERFKILLPWAAMAVAVGVLLVSARHGPCGGHLAPLWSRRLRRLRLTAMAAAVAGLVVLTALGMGRGRLEHDGDANEALFAAAARRPGVLLVSSNLAHVQLRTRRPILLNGSGLNALLYVPEAAPETDSILRGVYGIALRDIQAIHAGGLDHDAGRALWEARSAAEWQRVAADFGVSDVITYGDWTLELPRIAATSDLALYAIADRPPGDDKPGQRR